MKPVRIAPAAFQDRTRIGTRRDADKNSLLRSPNFLDMMSSKVSAQFAFDDLGCYQERHLAEAREICLCRRIDHLDIVDVFQKIERDGLDRTFAGDRRDFILKFANVVHVDRRHYRNPGVEERSEEHTSELQSQSNLVCRLLLEKKKRIGEWTQPR